MNAFISAAIVIASCYFLDWYYNRRGRRTPPPPPDPEPRECVYPEPPAPEPVHTAGYLSAAAKYLTRQPLNLQEMGEIEWAIKVQERALTKILRSHAPNPTAKIDPALERIRKARELLACAHDYIVAATYSEEERQHYAGEGKAYGAIDPGKTHRDIFSN